MNSYSSHQQKGVTMIVVLFLVAALSTVLIEKPGDILGGRGVILLTVMFSSIVAIVTKDQMEVAVKRVISNFSKKVYPDMRIIDISIKSSANSLKMTPTTTIAAIIISANPSRARKKEPDTETRPSKILEMMPLTS